MATEDIVVLETNIDDMNPEIFPYVIEKLVSAGARDAFIQPVFMKKGRIGTLLTVICDQKSRDRLIGIIFRETTTFGIRINNDKRVVLDREEKEVETDLGKIKVKIGLYNGKVVSVSPEYEDCRRLADKNDIPLKLVYAKVLSSFVNN